MTSLFLPDIGVTSDACDDKDSELLEVVFGSEINLHRVTGFKHLLPDYLQILLNLVTLPAISSDETRASPKPSSLAYPTLPS